MIEQIVTVVGKRIWILAFAVVVSGAAFVIYTGYAPVAFKMSSCMVRDETVVLHNTTYTFRTVQSKDSGGTEFRMCVKEEIKTHQTNLVETPAAKA
jgi:hypothetical protein